MITNLGKRDILNRIFNGTDKVVLHLYRTDKVLSASDTVASFDEVSGNGYVPKKLESLWNISTSSPITAYYSEMSFDFNASVLAYGYYITNSNNTIVLFSEKFGDGPYRTSNVGGSIKVTPIIQLD